MSIIVDNCGYSLPLKASLRQCGIDGNSISRLDMPMSIRLMWVLRSLFRFCWLFSFISMNGEWDRMMWSSLAGCELNYSPN